MDAVPADSLVAVVESRPAETFEAFLHRAGLVLDAHVHTSRHLEFPPRGGVPVPSRFSVTREDGRFIGSV